MLRYPKIILFLGVIHIVRGGTKYFSQFPMYAPIEFAYGWREGVRKRAKCCVRTIWMTPNSKSKTRRVRSNITLRKFLNT